MKLQRIWLLAAAAACVGCAEPKGELDVNIGGQKCVTLSVALPEVETRANNDSATSGKSNIDWSKYDLRYQIEVYDANDGTKMAFDRIVDATNGDNYTKEITLTAGRDYKVYVWADFVEEGTRTDLHYNTGDFAAITYKDGVKVNDESRDAYCGSATILKTQTGVTLNLTRPMGKLRVVTTDAKKLSFGQEPDNVVFSCATLPAGYNLKAGELLSTTTSANTGASIVEYGNEASGDKLTLLAAYLFGGDTTTIQFSLTSKDDTAEIYTMVVNTDIPVRPNKLTTLKGATLTSTANIECTIVDGITGEIEYEQYGSGNWVEK